METVLTGEPIPKVDPILVLELVLEMDPIPQIPIPAQNTVIPCPILIPTKNGIKTSLVHDMPSGWRPVDLYLPAPRMV